jgi:ribosomal protein S18 acetylase RimI-like enzyme
MPLFDSVRRALDAYFSVADGRSIHVGPYPDRDAPTLVVDQVSPDARRIWITTCFQAGGRYCCPCDGCCYPGAYVPNWSKLRKLLAREGAEPAGTIRFFIRSVFEDGSLFANEPGDPESEYGAHSPAVYWHVTEEGIVRHDENFDGSGVALVLREYESADWEAVATVHDSARVIELEEGGVDPRAFRSMAETAQRDEFFLSQTLVAVVEGRVVGFVSWNGTYVTWLYILPEQTCRGIGGRLLEVALEKIGPHAWTNLIATNEPARRLYQRAGMEEVWIRPGECEGYPCKSMRVALPTARMRDPNARRRK